MKKGFLLDMDGVLYRGGQPIPEALDFLRKLQEREVPFLLLTNHGCLTAEGFSLKLRRMGIHIPAKQIYSSAQATAEWLRKNRVKKVHAIGEVGVFDALEKCGIRLGKDVKHVVVGLDRKLTYNHLKVACRLIGEGAQFIGTNPDPSYPVEDGFAPECGALLASIQSATGKEPFIIGKPSAAIFQFAARRLGLPLSKLTMIGDRLDTDILGAKRLGVKSILVLTGQTTRKHLQDSSIQPDLVVSGLNKISF